MKRSVPVGALVLALLVAQSATITLGAQTTTFNLAGGLAIPTGDFGDFHESGYTLIAGIGLTQRASPIAFRAEGIYNEFNRKSSVLGNGNSRAGGITGNATYDFRLASGAFTPYVIGGIGFFSTRFGGGDSDTNVGWNVGGGLRFPLSGFSAYFEARYHYIWGPKASSLVPGGILPPGTEDRSANGQYFPVTFGIRF